MTLNRRNFLRTSLSGAALAVGSTALASCSSKPAKTAEGEKGSDKTGKDLELKLSFQEGIAPGESLNEKLDFMEKLGVVGFEPGGGGLASRVNEIKQALNGRNIKVSALRRLQRLYSFYRSSHPQGMHGYDERDHSRSR